MAVKRKIFEFTLCLLLANIIYECQCENNELPSTDITEDDIEGIPDPFQSFEQCLGESCEKETNAFVPSETFENPLEDLNSDPNAFLAERQSANIPNEQLDGRNIAEQPNNNNFPEFKPEYYQHRKNDYADEPNVEYNKFYNGRADTDPKERNNYANFDLKPEYNAEKDHMVPEERSENPQNNRIRSAKNYLPEARRDVSLSDYYDNRSGPSSPGLIHARSGYSPAKSDYRNDHDSFNFGEDEEYHSEEFSDDSRHSDFYDVRNEDDHPDGFNVRSGSGKYDRIESNKKTDLPRNSYPSHRKLSPNTNARKSEENQFDSLEDPTDKPYSKKIDILGKPKDKRPLNDYNYFKEPRKITTDFHDSSEENDSIEVNINRRHQPDYVNHDELYDTRRHKNKIFPVPKSNKNYLTVLSKDPGVYANTHRGHEIFPIPKSNKKYVRVVSKDSINRDNLYDTTHHEDEVFPIPKSYKKLYDTTHHEDETFPIPKSNKKYLTVVTKHDNLGDLYDTHHEDEIFPVPKSNKKYLTVLTKDSTNHDNLYDTTHHEDEIFSIPKSKKNYVTVLAEDSINHDDLYDTTNHEDEIFRIPKSNKKYLTVLAKHPINIQRKPIRLENPRNQHYPKDLPLSKSYKKYLKFLRTGENSPGRESGLRKYKYYDGEPNVKIMNQNMPKNHLAYIQTHPKEKDFIRISNGKLHNDNSRISKKYREKLKRLERLYQNTHPIAGDSIRTSEKYISVDPVNDPFSSEILASKFVSKKPKTQIPKNYANYLRRLSQEYPGDARERYNIKRILNRLEFHDDQDVAKHGDGLIEIPNDGKVFENKFYNTRIRQKAAETTGNKPVNLFHLRQKPEKYADKIPNLSDESLESLVEKYVRTNVAKLVGSPEPNKIADDTTDLSEPDIRNHYGKIDDGVYVDPYIRLKTEESASEIKKLKNVIEPLPDFTLNRDSKRNESIVNQQPNAKSAKIDLYDGFEDKAKNVLEFLDHNQNQTSNEVERKTSKSEIITNNTEGFQTFPSQRQNSVSTHENALREEFMNHTISPSVSHVQSENNSLIEPKQKQIYNVSVRDLFNEQNVDSRSGVSVDKPTSSDSLDQPILGHKSLQSDGETKLQEKMDGEPKLRQNSDNSNEDLGSENENDESGRDAKFMDNSEEIVDEMNLSNKSADEPNLNQKTTDSIGESNLGRNLNNSGDGTNAQQPFDDVLNNSQSEKSLDEPRNQQNFTIDSKEQVDKNNFSQNAFGLVDEPALGDESKFDDGNNTKKLLNSNFEQGYELKESLDKPNDSRTYEASLDEPNLRQSDDFLGDPKSKPNADILEEPSNTDKPGNLNNENGIRQSGEILDEPKSRLNADILDEPDITDKPHEIIYKPGIGRKSDDLIDERNQNQKNLTIPDETKLRQHAEILLDKPSNIEKLLESFYEHKSKEPNTTEESLNSNDGPAHKLDDLIDELNQNQKNHTPLNETNLRQHAEILLDKPSNTEKSLDPFYEHRSEEPNLTKESLNSTDEPAYKSDDLIDEPNQNQKNYTTPDKTNLRQHAEILLDKPSNTEKSLDPFYERKLEEPNMTKESLNSTEEPAYKSDDLIDEPNQNQKNYTTPDETNLSQYAEILPDKLSNTEKSLDPFYDPEKSEELLEDDSRENADFLEEPNMLENSPVINDEPRAPYKTDDLIDESLPTRTNYTNPDETKLRQHAEIFLNKTSKTEKSPESFYESYKSEELLEPESTEIADIIEGPNTTINSSYKSSVGKKVEDLRDEPNSSEKTQISINEFVYPEKTNDSLDEIIIREKEKKKLNESTERANSGHTVNDLLDKSNITESKDFKKTPNLYNESDVRQKGNVFIDEFNVTEKPQTSNFKTIIRNKFMEILDKLNPNRKYQNPLRELKLRGSKNTSRTESSVRQRLQSSIYHAPSIYNKTKDLVDEPNMMENKKNLKHESNIRQKSNESLESNMKEEPLNSNHKSDTRQKFGESLDETNVVEEPLNSSHEADTRQKFRESLDESNIKEKPMNSNNESDIRQKSNESLDESNVLDKPLNSNNESDILPKFNESLDESSAKEKPLNLNIESDFRQKSNESLDESNNLEKPLNSNPESDFRQKSNESYSETNVNDGENFPISTYKSRFGEKEDEFPDEINLSDESGTLRKPNDLIDETPKYNHESGIRKKGNELPGESYNNREVFLDINPDIQNMVYNTAFRRDDLCIVDGKVARGMDCLNTENDDIIVVSKRRFLDATQEFSNHYILFLRSLAELYPAIISDDSEFMRLFKIRRDFQENFNDKVAEIRKTKMIDEIARQVIKSIYDKIELRLGKMNIDELNIETDSVNDNLVRTKLVQVPESKNPPISEEETINNNLGGAGKAYDSGDGRKAYNLGEERIVIYNLGEKRQPNNKGAQRNTVDLEDEKKALILREEKIDKELEEERKIYHLGDEETADKDAINLEDEDNSDNLREERKVNDLGEGKQAYESGEERIDSISEEERKVNNLEESEKTDNLEEDERADKEER